VPLAERMYVYIQRTAPGCSRLGDVGRGARERERFYI
jgi:hypothetical protein